MGNSGAESAGGGVEGAVIDVYSQSATLGELTVFTFTLIGVERVLGTALELVNGKVQVNEDGLYVVRAAVNWVPQTTAYRADIFEDKNGTGYARTITVPPSTGPWFRQETTYVRNMVAGDTFALRGRNYHAGGLTNINGDIVAWRVG